jgi:hypothetical protein
VNLSGTAYNPAAFQQMLGLANSPMTQLPPPPNFQNLISQFQQQNAANQAQQAGIMNQLGQPHPVSYNLPPEVMAMMAAQQSAADMGVNRQFDISRGQMAADLGSRGMQQSTLAEGDINSLARSLAEAHAMNASNFAGQELGQIGNFAGLQLQGQGLQQQGLGMGLNALGNQQQLGLQGMMGQGQLMGQGYDMAAQAAAQQNAYRQQQLQNLMSLFGQQYSAGYQQGGVPGAPGMGGAGNLPGMPGYGGYGYGGGSQGLPGLHTPPTQVFGGPFMQQQLTPPTSIPRLM